MIIHNVEDRRGGWIGSFEVEAFSPDKIGETISIIYKPKVGKAEKGLFSSYRNGIVFALFSHGDAASGCKETDCYRVMDRLDKVAA